MIKTKMVKMYYINCKICDEKIFESQCEKNCDLLLIDYCIECQQKIDDVRKKCQHSINDGVLKLTWEIYECKNCNKNWKISNKLYQDIVILVREKLGLD